MSAEPLRPLPEHLEVVALVDNLVESQGYYPPSVYVETCWLPVIGPTSTLLYRRLGLWVCQEPEGVHVDTADLAQSMGLGHGNGKNSMLARGIGRLVSFSCAEWSGERLAVRRALPPLPERRASRLSASAYLVHQQLTAERRVS